MPPLVIAGLVTGCVYGVFNFAYGAVATIAAASGTTARSGRLDRA